MKAHHHTAPFAALFLLVICLMVQSSVLWAFAPTTLSSQSRIFPRDSLSTKTTTSLNAALPSSRRDFGMGVLTTVKAAAAVATAATVVVVSQPPITAAAWAAEVSTTAGTPVVADMKLFVDPQGLFSLVVPSKFYKIRRTDKGDLPDEKTGKGRRGSSIFTAGDLSKAEIIAVERYVDFFMRR